MDDDSFGDILNRKLPEQHEEFLVRAAMYSNVFYANLNTDMHDSLKEVLTARWFDFYLKGLSDLLERKL